MRFYTDGTEAVRIDSSQRVGIGTNSVNGFTHINGRMLVESPTVPSTLAISDSGDATKNLRLGYEPTWDVGSISASDFGTAFSSSINKVKAAVEPFAKDADLDTPIRQLAGQGAIPDEAKMKKGLEIFNETAGCAACHILKAAGAEGNIGPNLDTVSNLTIDSVKDIVTHGLGVMPAFGEGEILTKEEIDIVSFYVVSSANK